MNEPCTDKELWSASSLLPKYVEMTYNLLISLLIYEEEYGYNSPHSFPDKECAEAFENESKRAHIYIGKQKTHGEELFPDVISKIKSNLHIFADVSNIVDLEIEPLVDDKWDEESGYRYDQPDNILGTSAHHAGVLFLENALINSFWDDRREAFSYQLPPKINYKLLNVKIHQERLRVFRTSEILLEQKNNIIESFDDINNTFYTEKGELFFSGNVQYDLFKYIYQNRRASFEELKNHIPSWKKKDVNDGAIIQAKNRVNTILANANLLCSKYELVVRKGNVVIRDDVVDESNIKST